MNNESCHDGLLGFSLIFIIWWLFYFIAVEIPTYETVKYLYSR